MEPSMSDIVVSHSKIQTARRCMRKYNFKYIESIQPKKKAAPLFRGTILHEMVEARARNKDPYVISRKYAREHRALFREEREMYGETFMEDIERIFAGYARAWGDEKLKYEYIEAEVNGVLPGTDVTMVGYIDKIVRDKNNRRWLMDHKSCKNIPEEAQRFSDLQLVQYYYLWNKQNPKELIDGIIWDYLRTKPPTVPETLKNGELTKRANIDTDFYTYSNELRRSNLDPRPYEDILFNLKKRGSMDFFQRISLPAPPKEMVKSVVQDAADTAEFIVAFGKTVKTRNMTKNCSFDCDYYRLCHAEVRGLDADFVRKADFEERKPDDRLAKESD